jgi:aspartyl-tRNA(Asn)/glutamyl-tRNA(Gln) amidotransferase subunit C
MISREELEELALLARLRFGDEEAERIRRELSAILDYVAQLGGIDTEGIEPMTHAVPLDCPLRPDVPAPSLAAEEALAGAPQRSDDFFIVPRIIEGGS